MRWERVIEKFPDTQIQWILNAAFSKDCSLDEDMKN